MNPIKLIPFSTREAIRRAIFGKNHFHDLVPFAARIGVKAMFDVGAQRGYESILLPKAGLRIFAFEPHRPTFGPDRDDKVGGCGECHPFACSS
ncbi:MAG: hypothetical protein IPJ00_22640 [Saprospirales bacterium]|nr:hypothetical protein [Saprospirales bacterium]